MSTSKKYTFVDIQHCNMCGDSIATHKILGQRLNQSQGLKPKSKTGISVSVMKCRKCNLIYSNPQPIPFDLQDHYGAPPESYWIPQYFNWDPGYFSGPIQHAKSLLPFQKGMKALDIGAGIGKAMLSMQHEGFDVYGFEPSIPFYERAISKMNIPVDKLKRGAIEEVEYSEASFDFITFGAVFEHLYDPASCMEKALKWLKPNGVLHLEIPSSSWLIPKIINFYYRMVGVNYVTNLSPMHAPFHLHEFELKSFEELGKKLNFTVEKHYYEVFSLYFVPKLLQPLFRKYMQWTNTGMQLTVYIRKKA